MRVTGAPSNRIGMMHINISEAWALESNDPGTFQNAVDRECAGVSRRRSRSLPQPLEADARALLLEASARARATLQSLEALLRNLAPLKMPVNIVMISEGMFVARDRSSMTTLGRLRGGSARHHSRHPPVAAVLRHRGPRRPAAARVAVLRRWR